MKKYWLFLLSIVVAVSVAGCGTNVSSSAGKKKEKDVQTIVVGTGTQFPNICFIDDKGKLTGYDVEVVRAIDKELKDYKFEFKTMEFSNLLLSLESNKIDMIAHNMAQNAERKKKFLFKVNFERLISCLWLKAYSLQQNIIIKRKNKWTNNCFSNAPI